jgi:hypothetical protein
MLATNNLRKHPKMDNAFLVTVTIQERLIDITIDPDDVALDKTLAMANTVLYGIVLYESKARKKITDTFLKSYNNDWWAADKPKLTDVLFSENLHLKRIVFASDCSVDMYYNEQGMFGNHSLVAQSFTSGNDFEYAIMLG